MAQRGEASCPLTPSFDIIQTQSKILITTYQLLAICKFVYKQFDSPVYTADSNNFKTWLMISIRASTF